MGSAFCRSPTPTSVTWVKLRRSVFSWDSPFRCTSPASVILVPRRRLQFGQPLEVHQTRVGDLGSGEVDFKNFALVILPDEGSQLLQRRNRIGGSSLSRRQVTDPFEKSGDRRTQCTTLVYLPLEVSTQAVFGASGGQLYSPRIIFIGIRTLPFDRVVYGIGDSNHSRYNALP